MWLLCIQILEVMLSWEAENNNHRTDMKIVSLIVGLVMLMTLFSRTRTMPSENLCLWCSYTGGKNIHFFWCKILNIFELYIIKYRQRMVLGPRSYFDTVVSSQHQSEVVFLSFSFRANFIQLTINSFAVYENSK